MKLKEILERLVDLDRLLESRDGLGLALLDHTSYWWLDMLLEDFDYPSAELNTDVFVQGNSIYCSLDHSLLYQVCGGYWTDNDDFKVDNECLVDILGALAPCE